MANNNEKKNNGKEELIELVGNNLGLVPETVTFKITSNKVRDAVVAYFANNGVDLRDEGVTVLTTLVPEAFHNNARGLSPFKVFIGLNPKAAKGSNDQKQQNQKNDSIMNRLLRCSDADTNMHASFINGAYDDLNRVLRTIGKTDKKGNPMWVANRKVDTKKGKRRLGIAELDAIKLICFILAITNEASRRFSINCRKFNGKGANYSILIEKVRKVFK